MERLRPRLKTHLLKQQHCPGTAGARTQAQGPQADTCAAGLSAIFVPAGWDGSPRGPRGDVPSKNVSTSSPPLSLSLRSDSGTTHTRCQLCFLEADAPASCDLADTVSEPWASPLQAAHAAASESRGTGKLPRKHTHTTCRGLWVQEAVSETPHTHTHTKGPLSPGGTRRRP